MNAINILPIGKIINKENEVCIKLDPKYAPGLKGLEGFSHIQVLWWADKASRDTVRLTRPYVKGPAELGVFATRSPERPNPIAISNVDISYLDVDNGIVGLYYIDAFDSTLVLDLKPYTPSVDRVENPRVPAWCSHWPSCYEGSAEFDWEGEFNF